MAKKMPTARTKGPARTKTRAEITNKPQTPYSFPPASQIAALCSEALHQAGRGSGCCGVSGHTPTAAPWALRGAQQSLSQGRYSPLRDGECPGIISWRPASGACKAELSKAEQQAGEQV